MANGAKLTIIVRLFLQDEGKVSMLRQTPKNGGNYTMIGGKIDKGEMAVNALIRESFEEAGVKVKARRLKLVHVANRARTGTGDELVLVFRAKKWMGTPEAKERKKFEKLVWVEPENLPKNTHPFIEHVFKQYLEGGFYSEYFDPV